MKEPHTALFVDPTGCGKTERVLQLLSIKNTLILLQLYVPR